MDFSYFEDKPKIDSVEQKQLELKQLQDIADKVGSYYWSYKDEFANSNGVDTEDHIGPVAQELLKIPGLSSAVIQGEDGTLKIDTQYLSLATFSMLAALARLVGVKGDEPRDTEQFNQELSGGQLSDGGTTEEGSEPTVESAAEQSKDINAEVVQSPVETAETNDDIITDGTAASTASTASNEPIEEQ